MTGLTQVITATLWGLCVGLSFHGWGGMVRRMAWPSRAAPDWGLQAGWGMAFAAVVGGAANLLNLAVTPAVIGFVAIGAMIALWSGRRAWEWLGLTEAIPVLFIAILLVLHMAARTRGLPLDCSDDGVAYFGFIRRQLELGSVMEPFSLRRLGGMGGQIFLQSLVVSLGTMDAAYILDRALAPLLIYGLLRGMQPRGPIAFTLLAAVVGLALPIQEFNSQAFCSAIVLLLTLVRTLDWVGGSCKTASAVVIGMVVAGAISLRAHYLVAAALPVMIWAGTGMPDTHTIARLRTLAAIGLVTITLLLPWMMEMWLSSGIESPSTFLPTAGLPIMLGCFSYPGSRSRIVSWP